MVACVEDVVKELENVEEVEGAEELVLPVCASVFVEVTSAGLCDEVAVEVGVGLSVRLVRVSAND